ncbi:TPA: hypothetical protein HA344_01305 [Candidatus Bathyarchaeota archaeon]|nr:hypothetical protein [Candidatus Bathyarchaeota archaeon]
MIALGKIDKGQKCTVKNCKQDAVRSVSVEKAKAAGLEVEGKNAYVCEEHYKQFKKGNKKSDQIEKWRFGR